MNDDADPPIIDAHQHFFDAGHGEYPWLGENAPLHRYGDPQAMGERYLIDDFRRDTANQNVVGSVHMECEWDPADPVAETRWLVEASKDWPLPSVLVAQAWFERGDIAEVLAEHAAYSQVRGVRQKPFAVTTPADYVSNLPGTMADPRFRVGYALLADHGLHFELQTPYWHLHEAADLAAEFPETQIIVNHAGMPPVDRGEKNMSAWREAMRTAAEAPNIALKISGFCQPGRPWTVAAQRGVVLDCLEIFGVERCMFASNFPVDGMIADYDTIFDGFKEITADLARKERLALFHDNAARYYRI